MACEAAAGLQDFDLWKGVLFALLLGTVSHDHQLEGNDRQQCITYEEQRKLNHDVDSFCYVEPPLQAQYRCSELRQPIDSADNSCVMLRKYPVRGQNSRERTVQ